MSNTKNLSAGGSNTDDTLLCVSPCTDLSQQLVYEQDPQMDGQGFTAIGPAVFAIPVGAANAQEFILPQGSDGIFCDGVPLKGRIYKTVAGGGNQATVGPTGLLISSTVARRVVVFETDVPCDIQMFSSGFNGIAEFLRVTTVSDEFYATPGGNSNRPSQQNMLSNTVWQNNNNVAFPSIWIFRHAQQVIIDIQAAGGLSCNITFRILKTFPGRTARQCRVPLESPLVCAIGERVETALMCEEIIATQNWFTNFVAGVGGAGWDFSSNSGGTYNPALPTQAHVAGAAGVNRWRHNFVIPAGYEGFWRVTASGDLFDVGGTNGEFYYDGVLLNAAVIPITTAVPSGGGKNNATSYYITPTPGAHTFEFREGVTIAGSSTPGFTVDYRGVYKSKFPFQRVRCYAGAVPTQEAFIDGNYAPYVPQVGYVQILGDCS